MADALADGGIPFVFSSGYSTDIIPARHTGIPCCDKPADPGKIAGALFSRAER